MVTSESGASSARASGQGDASRTWAYAGGVLGAIPDSARHFEGLGTRQGRARPSRARLSHGYRARARSRAACTAIPASVTANLGRPSEDFHGDRHHFAPEIPQRICSRAGREQTVRRRERISLQLAASGAAGGGGCAAGGTVAGGAGVRRSDPDWRKILEQAESR